MSATGATLQPPITRVQARHATLPYGWPLYVAFGLFPVWYLLGFGSLIWFALAVPMTFSLVARSKVRVPRGFGFYLLFFLWMLATVMQLQGSSTDRLFGFAYRAGLYYSAGVWCLYIFNAPKRLLPTRTILKVMTIMWIVVVAGGWLGILSPAMEFTTVAEKLMPKGLLNNDLVYTLVHPKVAEVQTFLGYPVPRPTAPFIYTNDWGGNFALLVPFVLAAWAQMRSVVRKNLFRLLAAISVIPVVFSLNRVLWFCLVVTMVYGSVRWAIRGRVGAIHGALAVGAIFVFVFTFPPTAKLINDRVNTPHSNQGRSILYNEAADSVEKSPLLGYGAPRPSQVNPNLPSVGTQGHFWLVLFSHGIPGAFFFVAFFVAACWRTRRASSPAALWCHVVVLLAIVQMPFYGLLSSQLHIIMLAIALASREAVEPDRPEPEYTVTAVVVSPAGEPGAPSAFRGNANGNGSNGNGSQANGNHQRHSPWGDPGDYGSGV
jgi:polysaccharide biosynthesis protein PslJ